MHRKTCATCRNEKQTKANPALVCCVCRGEPACSPWLSGWTYGEGRHIGLPLRVCSPWSIWADIWGGQTRRSAPTRVFALVIWVYIWGGQTHRSAPTCSPWFVWAGAWAGRIRWSIGGMRKYAARSGTAPYNVLIHPQKYSTTRQECQCLL